ncbi:MAG: DUF4340 domain-containing protein [Deltaproteobacteria bacterium]|nr:DUF4340 domain-containing protein [Deltaproteobacteria bacterium]
MKRIGILSVLLIAGLVGSYLSWTAEEFGHTRAEGEVALFHGAAGDLRQVHWTSDTLDLTLERRTDALGEYTWVTADRLGEVGPEEEGQEEGPRDRISTFKGNAKAEELWSALSPLVGQRELGATSAVALEPLGLLPPEATLQLQRSGGSLELAVGGTTFGDAGRYVALDGKVFLVADSALRPLARGHQMLVERRLHPLKEEEAVRLTLSRGGQALRLVHQHRDDPKRATWALAEDPDRADEAAATWVSKLFRLRVQSYLGQEDPIGTRQPALELKIEGEERPWAVAIYPSPDGESWYARSTWSRGTVRLTQSLAAEVMGDLDGVMPLE